MIKRATTKVRIGDQVRHAVKVSGDDCSPTGQDSYVHQQLFVRWLADNPALLRCGLAPFQKLVMEHNGTCWEARAEATVDEPEEK